MSTTNPVFKPGNVVACDNTTPATTVSVAAHLPLLSKQQRQEQFILWLNGAVDVLSDTPPTQQQWDVLREGIGRQISDILAGRMLQTAQHDVDAERAEMKAQLMKWSQAMYDQAAVNALAAAKKKALTR